MDGRDLLPDEDELDREYGMDELFVAALGSEMLNSEIQDAEAATRAAEEEEGRIGRNYALAEISSALQQQLEEMNAWRTEVCGAFVVPRGFPHLHSVVQSNFFGGLQVLCATRAGKKVAEITAEGDKKTLLRLCFSNSSYSLMRLLLECLLAGSWGGSRCNLVLSADSTAACLVLMLLRNWWRSL